MKNKKITYFLIAAVAGVWGLIIYRVIASRSVDDDQPALPATPIKEAYNDYAIQKDTTKLLLNYRDPFGVVKAKDTAVQVHVIVPPAVKPAAPTINWSFVTYLGYIRNPASKTLVALVSINGQSFALHEGEVREQVKLIRNRMDSIEVSYQGKTKFIQKR